jgi:hypothetical protein
MQGDMRTLLLLGTAGVLAWLGWTAAQERWWARMRAERTALAYARAVYRQDSTALTRMTVSGTAHNSLCAGRWSLSRVWADPRVLRRVGDRDTVQYHIGSVAPTPMTFVFRIALARPDKVVGYDVPPLADSASAAGFWICTGWLDWPRVRRSGAG